MSKAIDMIFLSSFMALAWVAMPESEWRASIMSLAGMVHFYFMSNIRGMK